MQFTPRQSIRSRIYHVEGFLQFSRSAISTRNYVDHYAVIFRNCYLHMICLISSQQAASQQVASPPEIEIFKTGIHHHNRFAMGSLLIWKLLSISNSYSCLKVCVSQIIISWTLVSPDGTWDMVQIDGKW